MVHGARLRVRMWVMWRLEATHAANRADLNQGPLSVTSFKVAISPESGSAKSSTQEVFDLYQGVVEESDDVGCGLCEAGVAGEPDLGPPEPPHRPGSGCRCRWSRTRKIAGLRQPVSPCRRINEGLHRHAECLAEPGT